ncbi:MAG: hypothetical protein ACM31L_14735 [Actinomycetota bacterium]
MAFEAASVQQWWPVGKRNCRLRVKEKTNVLKKPSIKVGDRFVKIGTFQTAVWVVLRIFQIPSEPPHARLAREGDERESITVSLPTLGDNHYFKRA